MMEVCALCGKPKECTHHLVFGMSVRRMAEEDDLKIPMCNECHNMAINLADRIHGNSTAEKLSKMLGQAIWERDAIIRGLENVTGNDSCKWMSDTVREAFIDRYGRSYL